MRNKMDKFLEKYELRKLTQKEKVQIILHLLTKLCSLKSFSKKAKEAKRALLVNSIKHFGKISQPYVNSQKIMKWETCCSSFYEISFALALKPKPDVTEGKNIDQYP